MVALLGRWCDPVLPQLSNHSEAKNGGKFSKRPSLFTVVGNAVNPPRKLGPAGENLWNRVQSEYGISDVGGQELLMQACLAADRADELAAIIDAEGRAKLPHQRPAFPLRFPGRPRETTSAGKRCV